MHFWKCFYRCHLSRALAQGLLGSWRALAMVSTWEESWGRSSLAATPLLTGGSALGCSQSAQGQTFTEHWDLPPWAHSQQSHTQMECQGSQGSPPTPGWSSARQWVPLTLLCRFLFFTVELPCADAWGDFMSLVLREPWTSHSPQKVSAATLTVPGIPLTGPPSLGTEFTQWYFRDIGEPLYPERKETLPEGGVNSWVQEHLICVPHGSAVPLSVVTHFREPLAAALRWCLSVCLSLLLYLVCNSQVNQLRLERGLVKVEAIFLCAESLWVIVEKKESLFLACL